MKVKTLHKKQDQRKSLTSKVKLNLSKDYPWKILERVVDDLEGVGALPEDDCAVLKQIIRDRDIETYLFLESHWGLQCINPSLNTPFAIMRARYLVSSLLKKFQFQTEASTRLDSALTKFRKAEEMCKNYNHVGYKALTNGKTDFEVNIFTYARNFVRKVLGDSPLHSKLVPWIRHGPGATTDTQRGKVSNFHKFENWPYGCTVDAVRYARFVIETDQRWFGALQDSYRTRYNIPKHYPLNMREFWSRVLTVVDGNRICFVPKNAKTERSIAIEPTLNLYLQLGVDGFIRRRLKHWDIDLDSQEKNQRLANLGSTRVPGRSYSTLDLSMASDTLSLRLCEELLPEDWYSFLCALRSPVGTYGDESFHYEKISSMGNGYTFALESLIFAALSAAAINEAQGSIDFINDLAVFGDDIIVKDSCVNETIRALQLGGFSLNLEKSFTKGFVKESCGTDWVKGIPFRPVFLSTIPKDVMELFTDYNRLKRILNVHYGLEETKTLSYMYRLIPENFRKVVGPYSEEVFDSYIHSLRPKDVKNKNGFWKHGRLVKKPIEEGGRKAEDFLFRKLMHDLKPQVDSFFVSKTKKVSGASSRFTVLKRNAFTVSYTYSLTSYWSDTYIGS